MIDDIVLEVKEHLLRGRKEIVLIAQDTTRFGKENNESLAALLKELVKIEELEMTRILYMYVSDLTNEVIHLIKDNPKIAPYFDLPIQHASDKMLRLMNRRDTNEIIMNKIKYIKEQIPHAIIRTTLIVGFPNETEEDFNELLTLVEKSEFDRLGAFTYSPEEDTKGYEMDNQIDEEVKQARHKKLMELQQRIAYKKGKARIGEVTKVFIDRFDYKMNMYRARDYSFAPDDVDGCIFIKSSKALKSGTVLNVKITSNYIYDLIGEIVE
jgi:ribosomal protein S12 methylthiotransferase